MRIAIAGATGLIGTELVRQEAMLGNRIHRLVRGEKTEDTDIIWSPGEGHLAVGDMEGFDAVVCLNGAGIADKRWTEERKEVLYHSRVDSVSLLADRLASCQDKPRVLVCASAVGYYGMDRGDEVLTEDSAPGNDFLADICKAWEAAAAPALDAGIRVVNCRFGVVLSPDGGALKQMVPIFRKGMGGPLGSGRQYLPWISIADAVGIVDFVMQNEELTGPVNAVASEPVTNKEFSRQLASVLHRPMVPRVPKLALKAVAGEMAGAVLGSLRVYPRKLEAAEYRYRHPDLNAALEALLAAK